MEMEIKTTLRLHLTPDKWLRSITETHAGKDVEQDNTPPLLMELHSHFENQNGSSA